MKGQSVEEGAVVVAHLVESLLLRREVHDSNSIKNINEQIIADFDLEKTKMVEKLVS